VRKVGETVTAKWLSRFAFDGTVIPAGSDVGARHQNRSGLRKSRALAYSGGNFTPFHKYQITFDSTHPPDGRRLASRRSRRREPRKSSISSRTNQNRPRKRKKNVAVRAPRTRSKRPQRKFTTVSSRSSRQTDSSFEAMLYAHRRFTGSTSSARPALTPHWKMRWRLRSDAHAGRTRKFGKRAEPTAFCRRGSWRELVLRMQRARNIERFSPGNFSLDHHLSAGEHQTCGRCSEAKPRAISSNGELASRSIASELPSGALQAMQGTLEGWR